MSVYYTVQCITRCNRHCLVNLLPVILYHNIGVFYSDKTKFINDNWMVDKGYMESSVSEKDK